MSSAPFTHPEVHQMMAALEKVQGIVALTIDGVVTAVNDNYLRLCGYRRDELVGNTLARLMDPNEQSMAGQPEFWARLRAGETLMGEFKRIGRNGEPFWLSAVYMPIRGESGQVTEVVAFAVDITDSKRRAVSAIGKVEALEHSQAVIEFSPSGEIISANENYLHLMGYRLDEIRGRHHRMFMKPDGPTHPDYARFWSELAAGTPQLGEFERVTRSGQRIWIYGAYAPVRDELGRVSSVIKTALDITASKVAVNALIGGLDELSSGNLTVRLGEEMGGEFAPVRDGFNTMLVRLAATVDHIRGRAGQMNGDAVEISRGAGDLARRGESQAASMEQTAAAVEQISGNVAMTSQAAREADAAARDAQQIVHKGAEVVAEAIAAIERIDEHTKRMGEFTRVIEGFAFQTNLLSINAAVEAARAGEVGRGFAVVANEVRNLAQQSAKASQNIADLIAKSDTEVKAGVKLVRDAGASLDQIRTAVTGVVENISGIAHATSEQATGVREVSEALSQLDGVNQANLSLSEQYAAAAAALSSNIEELGALMERFRTDTDTDTASRRPPRPLVA